MRQLFVILILAFFLSTAIYGQSGLGAMAVSPEKYKKVGTWQSAPLAVMDFPRADLRMSPKGKHLFPTPGNQGYQGSCVGWATAYAIKSYQETLDQGWSPNKAQHLFSPAFIYNQLNAGVDRGITLISALELLKKKGCATLKTMPYTDKNYRTQPSYRAFREALSYRIQNYYRLQRVGDIRTALQQGYPVLIHVLTDPVFNSGRYQIFTKRERVRGMRLRSSNAPHGHHAMVIVGYDDYRNAFLAMNSWGKYWGKGGFCWISYDLIDTIAPGSNNLFQEAYVLVDYKTKSSPSPTPTPTPINKNVVIKGNARYSGYYDAHAWSCSFYISGSIKNITHITWKLPKGFQGRAKNVRCIGVIKGAGSYNVRAKIRFSDRSTKELSYYLNLTKPTRQSLKLIQTDRYWGKSNGKDYWQWSLKLQGGLSELADVKYVVYHLHPTFPNPNRRVDGTMKNGFIFTTTGWGTFNVKATVYFKDGKTQSHALKLKFAAPVQEQMILTNTARPTDYRNGKQYYDWTAYIDGPLGYLQQITKVRYFLHPTFTPNTRDITYNKEGGFPLSTSGWGTFTLGAEIYFKNGQTIKLKHKLNFSQK